MEGIERQSAAREKQTEEQIETWRIKQFFLDNGFSNSSVYIVDALAHLVYKSTQSPSLIIGKEYAYYGASTIGGDSFRVKLSYHIQKNFDSVHASLLNKYNYDIGKYYFGVKHFVEQIALAYSIFAHS